MPTPKPLPESLAGWLEYIEALHPKSIAMGLDRVNEVKQRLNLDPQFPIIVVGGTNGKGSACAMLEHIYSVAGYKTACYTSPHFLRYNERVRVAGKDVGDEDLLLAVAAVEEARESTPLTYFEFGTLAAVWHFMHSDPQIAILEVGLGGRLDAVNIFDPACTIVTAVDFDHMDFLGDNRESIGYEKAGIFRKGVPAICGDENPPGSLIKHANSIGANIALLGKDFYVRQQENHWTYEDAKIELAELPYPALAGDFQLANAACVIRAIESLQLQLPVDKKHIVEGLQSVTLAGRFQQCLQHPQVILDVAHNPHAAHALAQNLHQLPASDRTLAVFGMLADKDMAGVIREMGRQIDVWYLADIHSARGATAQQLARLIHQFDGDCKIKMHTDVISAYRQACFDAGENDRIIVFGSFYTVADVMKFLSTSA